MDREEEGRDANDQKDEEGIIREAGDELDKGDDIDNVEKVFIEADVREASRRDL